MRTVAVWDPVPAPALLEAPADAVDQLAAGPVTGSALDAAWDDAVQRSRCLDSLLVDGLVEQTDDGRFRLPA